MSRSNNMIGRALGHLNSPEVKLWHMIVGFVVTIVVTTGIQYWVTLDGRHDSTITSRSQDLIAASADFENKVHDYLSSGHTLETLTREDLANLSSNVDAQIQALNKLRPVLDNSSTQIADDYQMALVDFRDTIEGGVITVETTRKFGENAVLITQTRNRLLSSL
jgi:hypothetical protein